VECITAPGSAGNVDVPFIDNSAMNSANMQAILNHHHYRQRAQLAAILAAPNPIAPVNW